MGVGKTVVGDVIGSLFPANYFLVDNSRYLTGQFNAHMASCLLLQCDEATWGGNKELEGRLKGLITADKQMIEAKGVDPIMIANYVRVLLTSNEAWVVPTGMDERRWAILDVLDLVPEGERKTHYGALYAELDDGGRAALLADLLEVDLDAADVPNLRVISKTKGLLEQENSLARTRPFVVARSTSRRLADASRPVVARQNPDKDAASRFSPNIRGFGRAAKVQRDAVRHAHAQVVSFVNKGEVDRESRRNRRHGGVKPRFTKG